MDIKDKKVLFTINSNKKFYDQTTLKTLDSLYENKISDDIFVIIGGWESEFEYDFNRFKFYGTTYDSCDYTTFNYVVDNPNKFKDYTHIFYMHDTCWVGPKFLENLTNLTPEGPVSGYSLLPQMSMNIGLYEIQHLVDNPDGVKQSKNTDNSVESINKWKQWGAQHEDYLNTRQGHYCDPSHEEITTGNVYETTTPRRTRYFSDLDFYKSQSNWQGVLDKMNVDL